jgi:hypothetical protein
MRIGLIVTKTLPSGGGRSASGAAGALALALALLGAGAAAAQDTPPAAGANPMPDAKTDAKPAPAEPKPEAPRNTQPIYRSEAVAVLGKQVQGPGGENLGRVVDLLVDADSRPRAAVIDFGGFLGVGSRKVAVDWKLLQFRPEDSTAPVVLNTTRAEIQAAPEYKPSVRPAEVVAPPTQPPAAPAAPPTAQAPAPADAGR